MVDTLHVPTILINKENLAVTRFVKNNQQKNNTGRNNYFPTNYTYILNKNKINNVHTRILNLKTNRDNRIIVF